MTLSRSSEIAGKLPWSPVAGHPPSRADLGNWQFFTFDEATTMEALADRIIPPDEQTPGGKDADCAVFVDRQLAGPYGASQGHYTRPPFMHGTKQQGPQSATGPAKLYRAGLKALDTHCQTQHGKRFADLDDKTQDDVLKDIEGGKVKLEGADGQEFFKQLITDVQTGFFADPVYGGNRDMVAWKMIGFPGARYNYSDWIERHNERYPLPPVSIMGRDDWMPKG